MMRAAVLALLILSLASIASAQCSDSSVVTGIQLASLPYASVPAVLRVSDLYGSGAAIGNATATITGTHIDVTQTNAVAPTLPTSTCRVQFLDLGLLPAGNYDVMWTTTENVTIPFPSTTIRVRTLTFTILPASAIPAMSDSLLVLLAIACAAIAVVRS